VLQIADLSLRVQIICHVVTIVSKFQRMNLKKLSASHIESLSQNFFSCDPAGVRALVNTAAVLMITSGHYCNTFVGRLIENEGSR